MPTVYQERCGISLYDVQYSNGVRVPIPGGVIEEVVSALLHFRTICDDFLLSYDKVRVVATEATRTAINSFDFVRTIGRETGWEVELLPKEEEGRLGALGVASSFSNINGIAMDLGGGSVQISWVTMIDNMVSVNAQQSVSLPYGAAALKRTIEEANARGASEGAKDIYVTQFYDKLVADLKAAVAGLKIPNFSSENHPGGLTLYLSGGGFRGWGYLLMAHHDINPYPIPIINGFEIGATDKELYARCRNTVNAAGNEKHSSTFRISKRRATQLPAVSFLITALADALPEISIVHFAQGGLREGLIFSSLPEKIQKQTPLIVATHPFASVHALELAELLQSGVPCTAFARPTSHPELLTGLMNLVNAHVSHPKDIRPSAALRSTTTGILAGTHGLSHKHRALLALALCERWGGEVSSGDAEFHRAMARVAGPKDGWWAKYIGVLARGIGETYPSGVIIPGARHRLRFASHQVFVGNGRAFIQLTITLRPQPKNLPDWVTEIEKLGKPKHAVLGFFEEVVLKVE